MWNQVHEQRELASVHIEPTEDAVDGPGNTLNVCTDNNIVANVDNLYGRADLDGDPSMFDPLQIEKDYVKDRRKRKAENLRIQRRHEEERQFCSGDIGSFFSWMKPTKVAAEIAFLNDLYRT